MLFAWDISSHMEIERKFLVKKMPDLNKYSFKTLEQGYLCTSPTVRIRKEDDKYYLTYKCKTDIGEDNIAREEYNLPLSKEAYEHLLSKADGNIISKKRYLIPLGRNKEGSDLTAELDVFAPPFAPLVFAEVEFPTVAEAHSFEKPDWLGEDVSDKREYYNTYLASMSF